MYVYPQKVILSHLTPMQIFSLFENNEQFTGNIENTKFTVREKVFMTSNILFPVITGVVTERDDISTVDISFKLSKFDKAGYGTFLFIIFSLSLLLGFVSSDIILTMLLICFGCVFCVISLMLYAINCRRAFKKIVCLLESTT